MNFQELILHKVTFKKLKSREMMKHGSNKVAATLQFISYGMVLKGA